MTKETISEFLILILIISTILYIGLNLSAFRISGRYHSGNEEIISSLDNASFIENLPDKFTLNQVKQVQNCISFTLQEDGNLSYEYPYINPLVAITKNITPRNKNSISQKIFNFLAYREKPSSKYASEHKILSLNEETQVHKFKLSFEKLESVPNISIKADWHKIEIMNNDENIPYGINFVLNKPLIIKKEKINANHVIFYLLQADNSDAMRDIIKEYNINTNTGGTNWRLIGNTSNVIRK